MTPLPNLFNMLPFSGSNWQTIDTNWWSPNISVNFAGNAAIEREVSENVASYGSQIGWLDDIVVALAAAVPDAVKPGSAAAGSLKKLKEAQKEIEAIKKRRKTSAFDSARDALNRLGATDKDGYRRLVHSLKPDEPPSAAGR